MKLNLDYTPAQSVNSARADDGHETDSTDAWTPERYASEAIKALRQAWRDYLASQTATDTEAAKRLYQLHLVAISRARVFYRCAGYSLHDARARADERDWFADIKEGA